VQVKLERPIMRIPMLAIHLSRSSSSEGFKPNKQTEVVPILATAARAAVNAASLNGASPEQNGATSGKSSGNGSVVGDMLSQHHPALLNALADEVGCDVKAIVDLELNCCDTQPGQVGGIHNEFIYVGRLDNLAMSWCSMQVKMHELNSYGTWSMFSRGWRMSLTRFVQTLV
jgi:aspartyl aminopeptidase